MALLMKIDGTQETVTPARGETFSLKELQGYVGGHIELVWLYSGEETTGLLVVNEEGMRLELAPNWQATERARERGFVNPWGLPILGDVLVCGLEEID